MQPTLSQTQKNTLTAYRNGCNNPDEYHQAMADEAQAEGEHQMEMQARAEAEQQQDEGAAQYAAEYGQYPF